MKLELENHTGRPAWLAGHGRLAAGETVMVRDTPAARAFVRAGGARIKSTSAPQKPRAPPTSPPPAADTPKETT